MNTVLNEKTRGKISESIYYPCIAMVLPIEKGMGSSENLKRLTDRIENEIGSKYRRDKTTHVIEKLHHALSQINYSGNKKSVAIFVSPSYETVLHLDIPLEESIMVDEPFEIRDLVHSLHPADKYILLVQSAQSFRVFLGTQNKLIKLKLSIPDNIEAYKNDIAEKIEYFTDTTDRKEIMMDKFIHHIDKELDNILNKYHLPVFVLGSERMNGHFKKYTHHEKVILDYIHGNYDDATIYQLGETIKPYLSDLRKKAQQELRLKIEQAMDANKVAIGIDEVWKSALNKKGRMLIVEKNYYYPHVVDQDGNLKGISPNVNPSPLQDAVDIIIEKVLENGGEVQFADPEMLKDLGQIILIQYY